MTEARRKVKLAMLIKRIEFSDLQKTTGLAKGSIHNLLSDVSKSPRGRQLLTNAIQEQLWPDVPVSERRFTFTSGTEIEFTDEEAAKEFECEIGGAVRRDGDTIAFVTDFEALLPLNSERGDKLRKVRHV